MALALRFMGDVALPARVLGRAMRRASQLCDAQCSRRNPTHYRISETSECDRTWGIGRDSPCSPTFLRLPKVGETLALGAAWELSHADVRCESGSGMTSEQSAADFRSQIRLRPYAARTVGVHTICQRLASLAFGALDVVCRAVYFVMQSMYSVTRRLPQASGPR